MAQKTKRVKPVQRKLVNAQIPEEGRRVIRQVRETMKLLIPTGKELGIHIASIRAFQRLLIGRLLKAHRSKDSLHSITHPNINTMQQELIKRSTNILTKLMGRKLAIIIILH